MNWPPISRNEDKGLVRYVLADVADRFPLDLGRQDAMAQPNGRLRVAETIYDALAGCTIGYALELYDADARVQHVRSPETILGGAREGTCLDLALLYAGIALGKDLAPLIVMLDGHALVAVSLADGRRTAAEMPRRNREGQWLDEGVLRNPVVLRELIDNGQYIAIECTGFAQSSTLPPSMPEAANRVDGRLSFQNAVSAGRAQLEHAGRPFRIAVDVAVLRDRDRIDAIEPPAAGTVSPYQTRLNRMFADDRLFGGRDDEMRWLDQAVSGATGGYAFVTGRSGSGKTALLLNWVRRLLAQPRGAGAGMQLAHAFISQKYELTDQRLTLEMLCQQLQRARGRYQRLPDTVSALQEHYADLVDIPLPEGNHLAIVIDGLDEATHWDALQALFPQTLLQGVHLVFSAREMADRDWLSMIGLDADVPTLRVGALDLGAIASLVTTIPKLGGRASDEAFVEALQQVSDGDPFYLKFLLEDLASLPASTVADVQAKPAGLKGYLDRWWTDVAQKGKSERSVRDLLGYLVVAIGAIARDELVEIDDEDALDSFAIDSAVDAVRRYVIGDESSGYTLCHPRFREYLVSDRIRAGDQRPYRDRLLKWCQTAWSDAQFRYPLSHVVAHLAAQHAAQAQDARAAVTARMLALTGDPGFRDRMLSRATGLADYEDDCRATLRAAVTDPLPESLPNIVGSALVTGEVPRVATVARLLFDAADAGSLGPAAAQLPLIAPDPQWLGAGLLVAAWLCAGRDRALARKFLAEHAHMLHPDSPLSTLQLLERRVQAAVQAIPEPDLVPPYGPSGLPREAAPEVVRAIVARMGGGTDAETIGADLDPSMIAPLDEASRSVEAPPYIAERDSPWLVTYAISHPGEGESLIRRYIAAHAGNPYAVYRNRSLWGVLGAVLCLPERMLACDLARALCEAACSPGSVEYREMLALGALASAGQLGDPVANAEIRARQAQAVRAVQALHPIRGEADTWGQHTRRIAALAEVLAIAGGRPSDAAQLLDGAIEIPFGYAGYQSAASLALADANLVCRPGAGEHIAQAMTAARRAVHNVLDARFCAITTARMNAMRLRWWPGAVNDLEATVNRFAADPLAAEFAPVHVVGEAYEARAGGPNMMFIPVESLAARSLAEIARDVYDIPLARIARLNPGLEVDRALDTGLRVNVPDQSSPRVRRIQETGAPDGQVNVADSRFVPLLAARLAAEVLGRRAEMGGDAGTLIACLVAHAAPNLTCLDLVLARLLLAARPDDASLVARVRALAPDDWMRSPIPSRNVES